MSYRVYPSLDTSPIPYDYRVSINGRPADLHTARVSAHPFNRRWPGHQRPLDQSEEVRFLSLATDEALSFEITPSAPFEEVKIRPQSLGIKPTVENGVIRFTLDKPAYFTVEPYGRSHALHIFADKIKEYGIDPRDPGVTYFGAGEHDVGLIEMQSGQTLYLDEGAVVYASIHAIDAEGIRILGRGILDNSKNTEEVLFAANAEGNTEAVNNVKRRHTVQLEYCKDIEIDGITIRDSLVYNIRPVACQGLTIRNVKIIGCWRYNSDGIDMHNCEDVYIGDCFIRSFDDSICVKGFDCYHAGDVQAAVKAAMYRGGRAYDVFKNALIERCVIFNDWGKSLEIGAETKAEAIYDITFRDCDLIHLTGAALDCTNVDYADVHHVTFKSINIECDEEIPAPRIQKTDSEVYENPDPTYMPPSISIQTLYHHEYSKGGDERRGRNRDFLFENINVIGKRPPKLLLKGYDEEHKTERIRIRGLYQNGEPSLSLPPGSCRIGDFTADISLIPDPYQQLSKNSVEAIGQLSGGELEGATRNGEGVRILFVGNSITLHGIRPEVGWYNVWGMAASRPECDYVHRLERAVLSVAPDAAFGICQVAAWERQYENGEALHESYEAARDFSADIIVFRCIENCTHKGFDGERFKASLDALIRYLDREGKARLILTTSFWRHPGDEALRTYAAERGYPCIELGDLGEDDAMKAIGLFEHRGVANHPGDLGMEMIAKRIAPHLLSLVRECQNT